MGGIALGKGVTNSGLLETMDAVIRDILDGYSLYTVVLILSAVVLVRLLCYRSYVKPKC
jgi:phosphate transporter